MMPASNVEEKATEKKQAHSVSQQSADDNLSMTFDPAYRSPESSSSEQCGPRRLLESSEGEDTAEDQAMQKKKRTATSPLRRNTNICLIAPEEQSTNRHRRDDEHLLIPDEASSLVTSYKTKPYDAECSIRDIRYNHIHQMSTYYVQTI